MRLAQMIIFWMMNTFVEMLTIKLVLMQLHTLPNHQDMFETII